MVASGASEGALRMWDMISETQICRILHKRSDWVHCVAISTDEHTVISGFNDGTIRVWDLESATQIGETLKEHEYMITAVAINDDKRMLMSRSCEGTVLLWNRNCNKVAKSFSRYLQFSVRPVDAVKRVQLTYKVGPYGAVSACLSNDPSKWGEEQVFLQFRCSRNAYLHYNFEGTSGRSVHSRAVR